MKRGRGFPQWWRYLLKGRVRALRPPQNELSISEYLDWLRIKGYRIYNEVPGDSGNLDHVVVCTQGIYVIKTKSRRQPQSGDCVVEFNGSGISINEGPLDEAPVNEVRAQGEQLERILKEHTDRNFTVRPVLLFPGWHIRDNETPKTSGVWVLNPRSLGKWIDFRPASLHPDLVELATQGLDRYVQQFA
ncbi:MAG: NERD domain-containing protein [Gammaproteobacteria bacterium]|nr:NERD domain-containing protein [Gammaproteobacteria bacterium]MDH4313345.1 NERD domain-containing protein [Gammaproteobacteria bacterium]MDH5214010.1 NERD domain-containing protein [Gammaproteobacteria bacterium]MDH5499843.1 NERD domain-containing protein [Gammaproteobacteria bacterium]